MHRIYEVGFEHNKCFMDERLKRNKTYVIFSRFLTEPLFRNLREINLGYFKLEDVIGVNRIGIVLVLRNNEYFLMYRKFNPYA